MYEKPDHYTKKALQEGYAARSIYKLKEMQEKYDLIKKGDRILDLGCAPGSWSQYVSKIIGDKGLVVGIDYKYITAELNNAVFIKGNFLKENYKEKIYEHTPFDGIISDMAPDTSGDKLTDCYASSDLVESALKFAYDHLKKNGFFIAKIFQGGNEKEIMEEMKSAFETVKYFKPKSSRKKSFEIFLIGFNFIKKPEIIETDSILDENNYTGDMPW